MSREDGVVAVTVIKIAVDEDIVTVEKNFIVKRSEIILDYAIVKLMYIKKKKPQHEVRLETKRDTCHRCGLEGHWSKIYRTPKHFVHLKEFSKLKLCCLLVLLVYISF